MKIIFSTTFFGEEIGGTEISTKLLMSGLQTKSCEVKALTTRRQSNYNKDVIVLPFLNRLPTELFMISSSIIDIIMAYYIKKLLKNDRPNLVHIQDLYCLSPTIDVASKLDICTVVTVRNPLPKDISHDRGILINILVRSILKIRNQIWINSLKRADKIIAVSKFIKESLEKLDIPSEKIEAIYNLYPPWYVSGIKNDNEKIILFTASWLRKEKGIDILLMAISNVVKKNIVNFKLIIAGDGPHRKKLEDTCKTYNIDEYVEFVGRINYEEIQKLYSICDIVVFPSIYPEPFGRVAIEAGIMSKPIIASNIGGIPEIIEDRVTGILIPPKNSEKLSEAITELIENKDLREKMGENAKVIIMKKFDPDNILNQHIRLYTSLSNNHENKEKIRKKR